MKKNIGSEILKMALTLGHTTSEEEIVSKSIEELMPFEEFILRKLLEGAIHYSLVPVIYKIYNTVEDRLTIEEMIDSQIMRGYSLLQMTRRVQEYLEGHLGANTARVIAEFILEQAIIKLETMVLNA